MDCTTFVPKAFPCTNGVQLQDELLGFLGHRVERRQAFGRKSTFAFTPGTMVKFDCDPDFVLTGERRRWCYDTGDWNWAEKGEALCIRESPFFAVL